MLILLSLDLSIYRSNKYTCFAFFYDICEGCISGQTLYEYNKLQILYKDINFAFIPLGEYTTDDIIRVKRKLNINLNIVTPSESIVHWWRDITLSYIGKHPLIGKIVVVNNNKNIVAILNDIKELKDWINNNFNKELK